MAAMLKLVLLALVGTCAAPAAADASLSPTRAHAQPHGRARRLAPCAQAFGSCLVARRCQGFVMPSTGNAVAVRSAAAASPMMFGGGSKAKPVKKVKELPLTDAR